MTKHESGDWLNDIGPTISRVTATKDFLFDDSSSISRVDQSRADQSTYISYEGSGHTVSDTSALVGIALAAVCAVLFFWFHHNESDAIWTSIAIFIVGSMILVGILGSIFG